jgi:glycosyltransferase involved in cell wall biosynthesis
MSVAVLTPSFEYGRFIVDALDSVERQTEVDVQHVVQDGGSTDETLDILRGRPAVDWQSAPDRGQSDALNRALLRADCEWIAWLNADEYYLPGALRALVEHAASSGADVVYGEAVLVDVNGRFLRLLPQHAFSSLALRTYGVFMASCTAVFRRSVLGSDPWAVDLVRLMDWDLYLHLSAAGAHFSHLAYPCGAFRVHDGCVTAAPAATHAHEYAAIAERHRLGLIGWRSKAGHLLHSAMKAREGAYRRQASVRCLQGFDLRWMAGDEGVKNCARLLSLGYRDGRE